MNCFFFFFNDTATTEIYTLSLHDALPISALCWHNLAVAERPRLWAQGLDPDEGDHENAFAPMEIARRIFPKIEKSRGKTERDGHCRSKCKRTMQLGMVCWVMEEFVKDSNGKRKEENEGKVG